MPDGIINGILLYTRENCGKTTNNRQARGFSCLLHKVQCFIRISGSDKIDNLTCEIFMIISHVKIIAFQTSPIIASGHCLGGKLLNKLKNTWVLGNIRFISRVEHDISHSFAALTLVRYHVQHWK